MKKLGLLSVAAAVALTTSAYAADVKAFGDATVKGEYYGEAGAKYGNEKYNLEVNLGLEAKNDTASLKAGWVVYDAPFGLSAEADQAVKNVGGKAVVTPTLDFGYATLTKLFGVNGLTLKSGYIEKGEFGTSFTAGAASAFKPIWLQYTISDAISVGIEEVISKESGTNNKGGAIPFVVAEEEQSTTGLWAKGSVSGINYGVKVSLAFTGKTATTDATTVINPQAYVTADVSSVNIAAHLAAKAGDTDKDKTTQIGFYGHALANLGSLTTGLAAVFTSGGYAPSSEFAPTYIIDKKGTDEVLKSDKDNSAFAVVLPVKFSVNKALSTEANLAYAKLAKDKENGVIEVDLGAKYALGEATSLGAKFGYATGEGINGALKENKDAVLAKWELKTEF